MRLAHRSRRSTPPCSAFSGFRFPADVIVLAVRWYLRFGLSYRDVEELLAEQGQADQERVVGTKPTPQRLAQHGELGA
jgi:transposase-like protein